jgi:hypothetical protein
LIRWVIEMQALYPVRIACVALLGASAMFARSATSQTPDRDDALPVLYGAKFDDARVAVDVISFGCTDASYFSVRLEPDASGSFRLAVISRRQDRCRLAPHIVTVTLDVPAIPNSADPRFAVVNAFALPGAMRRSPP